jgi:dimethylhistidine N-methyltransferase
VNLPLKFPGLAEALPTASPQFINLYNESQPGQTQGVAQELEEGLLEPSATVSPKFFYNELGSKLFEAITGLEEYYPTRTEAAIFAASYPQIAATLRASGIHNTCLIDLGAGNCAKAASLFPLLKPAQYVPIDISADFLEDAVGRLQQRFRHIEMRPLGMDLSGPLNLPDSVRAERRLFFYPGSSIGNFNPDEARDFLQRVHTQCGHDGAILIGIDLAKDHAVLDEAYDDPLGVTAAFNLNVLNHVNRLLGADFDIRQWRHRGFYNPDQRRVEMHLEAKTVQTVGWRGGSRRFEAGEWIHTENSYKYRQSDAVGLLEQSGFAATRVWTDPENWFAVIHARALSH